MFDDNVTQATGAPETGGEGSPTFSNAADAPETDAPAAEFMPATEAAPSAEGEGASPGPVPYDRFQEVTHARREAEERLNQFSPYTDLVDQLRNAGLSGEDALRYLLSSAQQQPQQQPQQPTPEEQFHNDLLAQGLDPDEMDSATYAVAQRAWATEQRLNAFAEAEQAREQRAIQAELSASLTQVEQRFPLFANEALKRSLLASFAMQVEQNPRVTLETVAQELHGQLEAWKTAEIATYQAAKQRDGQAPVIGGGSSPPPVEMDFASMSREQRQNFIASRIEAIGPVD